MSPNEELRKESEDTINTGSSLTSLAQAKAEETDSVDDGGLGDYQVRQAKQLAVVLFPNDLPDVVEANVASLVADFGSSIVVKAVRAAEKLAKSEPVGWGYVIRTAGKMAKQGGAITTLSVVKETPKPMRPETVPVRTRETISEGRAEKWSRWLASVPRDLRDAIEAAPADKRKSIEDDIDRSNSPAFREPAIRLLLDLAVPPELARLKPTRPIPVWTEPVDPPLPIPECLYQST